MSKITLIKPKNDLQTKSIPLGLLHVGTVLDAAGYDVDSIDAARQPNYKELISRDVDSSFLVGITSLTTEVNNAIEISDYIRSISDVPIVLGGWHPTLFSRQTCADKAVDFVCIGEGESTILKLASALESGSSVAEIDGLVYKNGSRVEINRPKGYVNMEELPPINYDLVDISNYVVGDAGRRRAIDYQSSRGCPHRCKFCINVVTRNQTFRQKSFQKVVDEVQILVDKYDVDFVNFVDDNFFVDLERVRRICREMIARGLDVKWFAECRADYLERFGSELLDLAVRSGLSGLSIGAESGSQRILNLLQKDITVEQIVASARILSRYDVEPSYGFIIGTPWETKEEVIASVELAKNIKKICPRASYAFGVLTPYPKCEVTDELIQMGFFREPTTFREWSRSSIRELYAGRFSRKPWLKDPVFVQNLAYYSRLAYNTYSDELISYYLRKACVRTYPDILSILIARIRMKCLYFEVPIDRILFRYAKAALAKV